MSVLAVAPAAQPAPYEEQVAALVDVAALVARGLDLDRRRFVPAPSDPLFGYARCPVRGCLNVTEHTATSLCSRCQHRYGRWQHATGGSDLEHFLAEVTQTRSEDLERLCLVCRTPGHERPAAAQRLCYSCLAQAKGRGQSVAAYIAGDERLPPAAPRPTFGPCRMACDALACGGDGLCGEHLRRWRRAGRPAGAAFDAWRERVGEPLPGSRHVDLGVLSETLRWEFLLGLSVAIDGHRRTRVSELRRVVSLIGQREVASITELDASRLRTDGVRLFVSWAQDRLRLAFADPDREWRKDVWDMRVFGKPQAYRVDFTQISQPWLRELAKQWAREQAPLVQRRLDPPRGCLDRRAVALTAPPRRRRPRPDGAAGYRSTSRPRSWSPHRSDGSASATPTPRRASGVCSRGCTATRAAPGRWTPATWRGSCAAGSARCRRVSIATASRLTAPASSPTRSGTATPSATPTTVPRSRCCAS